MNYYDILEISPDASDEVIRTAYKSLAKKYHPDTYDGDKAYAETQMKRINEAYETLSDSKQRAAYDECLNLNYSVKTETYGVNQEAEIPYVPIFLRWWFIIIGFYISIYAAMEWSFHLLFFIFLGLAVLRILCSWSSPEIQTTGITRGITVLLCGVTIYSNLAVLITGDISFDILGHLESGTTEAETFDYGIITDENDIAYYIKDDRHNPVLTALTMHFREYAFLNDIDLTEFYEKYSLIRWLNRLPEEPEEHWVDDISLWGTESYTPR